MRLARRIALWLGALATLVLVALALLDLQEDWRREREDAALDHKLLSRTLAAAFEHTWRTEGAEAAQELLEQANTEVQQVHLRWLWLQEEGGAPSPSPLPWKEAQVKRLAPGDRVSLELDDPPRYLTLRALAPAGRLGAIEIEESFVPREDRLAMLAWRALAATALLVAMFFVAAMGIGSRLVGRPIEALIAMARRLSRGQLDARVEWRARDELAELGVEMNAMAGALQEARERLDAETRARLAALEGLRHAERLSTVGTLAAGVAHELGTPMTVIDGHAREISASPESSGAVKRSAGVIRDQVRTMTRIIQALLGFARRSPPSRRDEPLKVIAGRTLDFLSPLASKKGVQLSERVPEALQARVDAAGVQQVLTNLVLNGIQATPRGGEVEVTAQECEREAPGEPPGPPRHWVRLDVLDTGAGLAEEVRPHLFEPFYTTKEVGEGTGLGLSVSWGIVRDHGGFIEAAPRGSGGTRFSVFLP